MFITKKHLSRRAVLRGMGASVSLPLLNAMIPAATALANTAAAPHTRLGFFYFPHGAIMEKWTPAAVGAGFEVSPILEPLAPFRDRLTVVSNIGNKPGESRAVHALVPATWLSCVHPQESLAPNMAPTIDQIAAQHIGQDTPYPSLESATAQGHGVGSACERGYGCSYSGTLSFRTATTPLPIESNPRQMFLRLFGQGDTPDERRFLNRETTSLLDMISSETNSLSRTLGPTGPCHSERLSGQRARGRAPVAQQRAQQCRQAEPAGSPGCDFGELRRAPEPDVRSDRAGLPGRSDPHPELHDRPGSQ